MKKILYLTDSLVVGGAERQLVELLKGINKNRYILLVVTFDLNGHFAESIRALNIPIYHIQRKWRWDVLPLWNLFRLIKKEDPEIIHAFGMMSGVYGLPVGKLCRKHTISNVIRGIGDKNPIRDLIKKNLSVFSDVVVANSKVGLDYFHLYESRKYRVIYNGVDPNRFLKTYDRSKVIAELGLEGFSKYIVMIGGLKSSRDHITYFSSVKYVIEHFPGCCFIAVGDGVNRTRIEKFIKAANIESNVRLLGSRSDVERILSICDISVLVSALDATEGISNAILESMAMAIPTIATNSGASKEAIKNEVSGYIIPPSNAEKLAEKIICLLTNTEKARQMGDEGKRVINNKFPLHRMVQAFECLYDELKDNN